MITLPYKIEYTVGEEESQSVTLQATGKEDALETFNRRYYDEDMDDMTVKEPRIDVQMLRASSIFYQTD